ncbi:Plant organelle RNA recognition domain-containing protein [Artemisia annua]|uniref:Plant organelle RNA recognition domain-containing protein n=1 Tax=Artemisia annua TaxID=35608 RepID=A0A2U1M5H4_ARTAN|nr:Plant organelle RNA recognition domain-containing protein [Artemisia annua]
MISRYRKFRQLVTFFSKPPFLRLLNEQKLNFQHTQKHNYTNVYMKWKKDSYFDTIDSIHNSLKLKPVIALKNCIVASPQGCIPISDVSKKGLRFDIPFKVAKFLRMYPSVFEEFTGPEYNLPWFRLTPEAVKLNDEEQCVYRDFKDDLEERLVKFVLMSVENRLPLKVIKGMLWYLGLPDDYLCNVEGGLGEYFEVVEMGDGLKGLAVSKSEKILSVIQKNALRSGVYSGGEMEAILIPLFPSKGLRLRTKILDWLDGFQKLPYVSPYEKCPNLYPDSDVAEKRVVGLLHELLSLFVEHSVERKRVLCLRKYLGLPQKVHKAFERHPHVFYLSLRNNTCTAILKEAYCDETAIEAHPLAEVRKKYINLVKESKVILKNRRRRNQSFCSGDANSTMELDEDDDHDHDGRLGWRY